MTNSSKKIIVGVLGAAAVGTAAYLLLSSDKGSDWRKKFADSANDIACRIGEMFTNTKEKVQST
jgi:gas vesicle protein